MAIPDYQTLMLPLLRFAGDGKEHSSKESREKLASEFSLTDPEVNELLPGGGQRVFANRVGWARFYLGKAGLLESLRKGWFKITPRGLEVLAQTPSTIDVKYLRQFREFVESMQKKSEPDSGSGNAIVVDPNEIATPEETLQRAFGELKASLATDVLREVKSCSPGFFERLVVELLVAMGYGGTLADAGRAVGKSGDGGIDGIIKEDRLGLDVVYLQAKRWESNVSRPEIQKFAGALQGFRARKGVFITTSSFTKDATDYVSHIESKIVLIDGEQLAQLMIEHNIGVSFVEKYELKRVDSDYFSEE
jgi:restriction system protein